MLPVTRPDIAPMSSDAIAMVTRAQNKMRELEQPTIVIEHKVHAGVYSRTARLPTGCAITGALVKCATQLILDGHAMVFIGDDGWREYEGFNVLVASAGRKQAFIALSPIKLVMLFATKLRSIKEIEKEFTDEWHLLPDCDDPRCNHTVISGA